MTIFAVNPQCWATEEMQKEGVISIASVAPRFEVFQKVLWQSKEWDSLVLSLEDIEGNLIATACWLAIHNEIRVYVPSLKYVNYKFLTFNRRFIRLELETLIDLAARSHE